jgi:hypothetical protein
MASCSETRCPVYEQTAEAIELLFGSGLFRGQGRLTGFGGARNIIRIRTNCMAAADKMFSMPPELRLRRVVTYLAVRQFDAGLRAC